MSLIVQKYGGSSLADADKIRHVAGRIAATRNKGSQVVVVCSAMGDATDDLIKLAH
ncbi:MAG: aspartate kinase, partial [Chloroflexi bacterium]|nr:aspartate kinase [Chloroflexota bacterium]